MRDLSSQGNEPRPLAVEAQDPSQWTTKGVPKVFSFLISKVGVNYLLYKELKCLAHSGQSTKVSINTWISTAVSREVLLLKTLL